MAGLRPDAPCGGRGSCGKCRVLTDAREVLACRTAVERDVTVLLPEKAEAVILTADSGQTVEADGESKYALAFDIGTTTIAGYLLGGKTGRQLASASCLNPQAQYGADVISRIQYVLDGGAEELKDCVRAALADLTDRLTSGMGPVDMTAIAGNTAMHHLLLGIDPRPLVTPPYMPAVFQAMERPGLRVLPNIAGFVGGDTVGCMLAARFDRREELTLLIDIGTNGEMVLGNRHRRMACSTAAGPAFEGAKISCGMRGAEGAVDHVFLGNGRIDFHVIGGGEPAGLCGSGLLDLTAVLLELGQIDESGALADDTYRLPGTSVVLTQRDVREVQLAKAAIRAGIELLARKMGVRVEDIREVLLAGAFGNYLTPASACRIGMIPDCLLERIHPVGNAAGEGAKMCAVSRAAFVRAQTLAEETEFLELASMPEFQDCFVDSMEFPEVMA